jgi:hypothetical protein
VVPAVLECVEKSVFDFGCDVAVGLDEAVGEVVAEASGLGDFGDVVGDEPGLVTVSQAVVRPGWIGSVRTVGLVWWLPSAAGRRTRRSKVLRHNRVPLGVVNTYW